MEDGCLYCSLLPSMSLSYIFGGLFFEPCQCRPHNNKTMAMRIYTIFVQGIYIAHFVLLTIQLFPTDKTIGCGATHSLTETQSVPFVRFLLLSVAFLCGVLHKAGRSHKIILNQKLSSYSNEREKLLKYQKVIHLCVGSAFLILAIIMTITISKILGTKIEEVSGYWRSVICSVFLNTCVIYECGIGLVTLVIICLTFLAVKKRFDELSYVLQFAKVDCPKQEIDNLMAKHAELCDFIDDFNEKESEYHFFIYGTIVAIVSTCIYSTLFGILNTQVFTMTTAVTILLSVSLTLYAFAISRLAASAYDSFQEIRRLGASSRRLEDKLKLLNFMKKFREKEIGLNCGDCFIMSKECPVKIFQSLYGIFDMLLQIRDILAGKTNKCINSNYNVTTTESLINL